MEPISKQEADEFRKFLEIYYGKQVNNWKIDKNVINLIEKIIRESSKCSDYMDFVPRPLTGANPLKWASKQARGILLRYLKSRDKHYILCLKGTAYRMANEMTQAGLGI